MEQSRNSVRKMLLLTIGTVLALGVTMADEPKTGMAELLRLEPVSEDALDFEKQFPQTYDSPLHGRAYLAAGQVDPNAPVSLSGVPVFMAVGEYTLPVDIPSLSERERTYKAIRQGRVRIKLQELIWRFTLEIVERPALPGFDVTARYGAVVSYEEGGVRHYELLSFKLIPPQPDFPAALIGEIDQELIATMAIK